MKKLINMVKISNRNMIPMHKLNKKINRKTMKSTKLKKIKKHRKCKLIKFSHNMQVKQSMMLHNKCNRAIISNRKIKMMICHLRSLSLFKVGS